MRSIVITCLTIVSINVGAGGPLAHGKALSYGRETPVVRVYAKTHNAVVNISGQKTVARSIWPQFDWPDTFDLRGPQFGSQPQMVR